MDPSLLRIREAALRRMQTDWRQQNDSPTHHERLHADSGAGQSTPGECIRHFLSTPPAVESQESQPPAENRKLERKKAKSEIEAEESSVLGESEVEEVDEPPEVPVLKRPAAQGSGPATAKRPATAKTKVGKRPAASMKVSEESKPEGDGRDGEQGHRAEKKSAPTTAKTKAAKATAAPKKSEADGGGGGGGQGHRVDKKPAAAEPSHKDDKDDFVDNPRAFPNAVRSFVDDTGNWQARFLKAVLRFSIICMLANSDSKTREFPFFFTCARCMSSAADVVSSEVTFGGKSCMYRQARCIHLSNLRGTLVSNLLPRLFSGSFEWQQDFMSVYLAMGGTCKLLVVWV